jgi:acetoin utilization deacetylase AcuC-like enzyme
LRIVFHPLMIESYDNTPAGAAGRLDSAISVFRSHPEYQLISPEPASEEDIVRAHSSASIERVKAEGGTSQRRQLYKIAALAAGGAILTANIAIKGEPTFGLIRPPGHHASRSSYWGFCYFNNMAIALLHLQARGLIRSAFVLDFDLHFGDGTVNILGEDRNFHIHNPQGHGDDNYISDVKLALDSSPDVDIIGASAGFDEYEHCWGHNLSTDAFRRIGHLMFDFARERCEGRRFGLLEGGYNHEDLGRNILAFCEGLQGR